MRNVRWTISSVDVERRSLLRHSASDVARGTRHRAREAVEAIAMNAGCASFRWRRQDRPRSSEAVAGQLLDPNVVAASSCTPSRVEEHDGSLPDRER